MQMPEKSMRKDESQPAVIFEHWNNICPRTPLKPHTIPQKSTIPIPNVLFFFIFIIYSIPPFSGINNNNLLCVTQWNKQMQFFEQSENKLF